VQCAFELPVRFTADALFGKANFFGDARFMEARFDATAVFENTSFFAEVWFVGSRFAASSRFSNARFTADAFFVGARFQRVTLFSGAQFVRNAWFGSTHFAADARFEHARFGGFALFNGAHFAAKAHFEGARFSGDAGLDGIRFERSAKFGDPMVPYGDAFAGDLSRADVRGLKVHHRADPGEKSHALRRLWRMLQRSVRRFARLASWTLLRGFGELSILSRISVLSLILVPPLASAWPAIRAGVVGYNEAVRDATARFEAGANALHDAAAHLDGAGVESLAEKVRGVESSIDAWNDRFGRMTMDEHDLPASLAWAFFAAVCVTLGQLVYQTRVPARIRKFDEDAFVEWMHDRYPEDAKDRDDGLRRACDALAALARKRDDRHPNFITHHGETVWIPPKEHIEWFRDREPEAGSATSNGANDADIEASSPTSASEGREATPGYLMPGAERARIALEEGARAEYWLTGQERQGWAWLCLVLYFAGMGMLLVILALQGISVGRSAGFW